MLVKIYCAPQLQSQSLLSGRGEITARWLMGCLPTGYKHLLWSTNLVAGTVLSSSSCLTFRQSNKARFPLRGTTFPKTLPQGKLAFLDQRWQTRLDTYLCGC